ncbi:MAG: DUF2442 domain-containing protein [Phormidesmis sp.]
MKYPRILRAKVTDDYTLIIEFSDKSLKQYSFRHLLLISMFAPLQNPTFFKSFKIEPGGYALVWNEDIDISEYELWKNGTSLQGTYDSAGDATEKSESDCLTS